MKDEDSRKSEQRPDKNVKNMHPIRNKTRYGGAKIRMVLNRLTHKFQNSLEI